MTFDNSKHAFDQQPDPEEEVLEQALSADSLEGVRARLSETEAVVEQSAQIERAERLLRDVSMATPSAGFAERVMAAIAALPLPEYVRRELSVGLALGLLAAMALTVPLLVVAFVALASVVTSPSAWSSILHGATSAASTLSGLLLDAGDGLESLVSGTAVLPALLAITIPLVALWSWVLWQFWGKGRASFKR